MGEQGIAALAVSKEATLAKHAGRLRYASKLALQVNCPVPGRHTRLLFKIPRFGRWIHPPPRSTPLLGLGLTRSCAFQSAAIRGRQLFGGARLRQYPFHQHPPAFTSVRSTKFDRMLRDPAQHPMPFFAGQRVRTAEVIVELAGREPVVVVRTTFAILTFDGERRIVPSELHRQQVALAEVAVAPVLGASRGTETVVDAATDSSREALLDTIRHPGKRH